MRRQWGEFAQVRANSRWLVAELSTAREKQDVTAALPAKDRPAGALRVSSLPADPGSAPDSKEPHEQRP